jgi:hypothetical protein
MGMQEKKAWKIGSPRSSLGYESKGGRMSWYTDDLAERHEAPSVYDREDSADIAELGSAMRGYDSDEVPEWTDME